MAQNQNFYDLNAGRGYPVDDGATGIDDAGRPIPPGLLVDCRLRFPATAGRYAFLGALTATDGLVSVIFLAADEAARPVAADATGAPSAVPLAAVTLPLPIDIGRHYAVDALYPGTAGWVVFGPGVESPYSGRFSSVSQGQILPRCARPYRLPPVPSIGKEFVSGPLTGLVKVLGGADIEVTKGVRLIDGVVRDCLVVRLADDLNRNVLQLYSGPCAGRPESGTCGQTGLELINSIGPDCAGDVTIEFRNVVASPFAGGGGITLDLAVGLADACPDKYLPAADGTLPGEYTDVCSSVSLVLPSSSSSSSSISSPSSSSIGPPAPECVGLPYGDGFDQGDLHAGWTLAIGAWGFAAADSPEEQYGLQTLPGGEVGPAVHVGQAGWLSPAPPVQGGVPTQIEGTPIDRAVALTDPSRRNVLIWDDCGYDYTLGLTCRTHLQIGAGTAMNGGLVLNYQVLGISQRPHYHLLLANASSNSFELWYFNGSNLSLMTGITLPAPWRILPILWYEVVARTRLGATGMVVIEGTLRGVEQPAMPLVDLSLAVNNYLPASGKFGLGTDRSAASFSFFELQEAAS